MSALKKQRIDLRLNEDDKHMIEEAAAMTNQSISQFIDRNLNPQKTKKAPQNGCFFNTPCAPY
ncbi:DUF1778 domain-containing protein, partial [Escherichia coli]|nr:DUF1778 domain-containing protein [Escherichia coli]